MMAEVVFYTRFPRPICCGRLAKVPPPRWPFGNAPGLLHRLVLELRLTTLSTDRSETGDVAHPTRRTGAARLPLAYTVTWLKKG